MAAPTTTANQTNPSLGGLTEEQAAIADDAGLDGRHLTLLRLWRAANDQPKAEGKHQDDWAALGMHRAKLKENQANLKGYKHSIMLKQPNADPSQPGAIVLAEPGEQITLHVAGFINNNKGDTCIHQSLLCCGDRIVGELSNSVPCRGKRTSSVVTFTAPPVELAGKPQMLWQNTQLQYSMADARQLCEKIIERGGRGTYPGSFWGWVFVSRWHTRGWAVLLQKLVYDKRAIPPPERGSQKSGDDNDGDGKDGAGEARDFFCCRKKVLGEVCGDADTQQLGRFVFYRVPTHIFRMIIKFAM